MSINYCTLASSTLDSFCGNRRALVLDRLIDELRPPVTPSVGSVGWTQRPPAKPIVRPAQRPYWQPPEVPRELPTELERITVTAEFLGLSGTDTQAITARPDLVTVTDIHIVPTEVGVNIVDFEVTQDA